MMFLLGRHAMFGHEPPMLALLLAIADLLHHRDRPTPTPQPHHMHLG
jgi:hypothetical protein